MDTIGLLGRTLALVAALALGAAPLVTGDRAGAAEVADVSAPALVSGTVDKRSFSLAAGPATFTVTVTATDATGVEAPVVSASSTTTGQSEGFGSMTLVAGTAKNGTWQRTITIPRSAAPGTWEVTLFPLRDSLGNSGSFTTLTTLTLTGAASADTSPPVLVSGTVDKKSFSLASGPATFTVTVKATDATGVTAPVVSASSTTTDQSAGFGSMTLVAGTTKNGTWQRTITIPSNAAPGAWEVTLFPLADTLGNDGDFTTLATITLSAAAADTKAPSLLSSSVDKSAFALADGPATFTVTVKASDATGVTTPTVTATSTTTTQSAGFGSMTLVAGTTKNGTWQRTITIPSNAAPGAWEITLFPLADTLGNSGSFATVATVVLTAKPTLKPGKPTIVGSPAVGTTLTAKPGTWATGTTFTYQWFANGTAISTAKASTYKPTADTVGKALTVKVTGSLAGYTSSSGTSAATAAVAKGVLSSAVPTVSGTPKVGVVLTAKAGTWTTGTSLTYQWSAAGKAVSGATKPTFTPGPAQVGAALTVQVTGSLAGHVTVSRTSAATPTVAKGTLTAPTPVIAGSPKVGTTLSAKPGAWTVGTTLAYQWSAGGTAIPGATRATFVPTAAQVGKTVTVKVTGSLSGYATVARTSTTTAAVIR